MIPIGNSKDNFDLFLTTFNVDGVALLAGFSPSTLWV